MKKTLLFALLLLTFQFAHAQIGCVTTISISASGSTINAVGTSTGGVGGYSHSYTLNPGSITNSTGVFNGISMGWYQVCVTGYDSLQSPCTTACDSIYVGNTTGPCSTILSSSVSGNTVTGSATSTGGSGPYSYTYTLNPGSFTNTTGVFSGLTTGWYNLCVTGYDNMQTLCSTDCDSVYVGNSTGPCTTTLSSFVSGNTINAVGTSTGGQGPYSHSYTVNPGSFSNTSGIFPGMATGAYQVCVTGYDSLQNPCSTVCDSVFVGGTSGPCSTTINLTTAGSNISATGMATGGNAPYTYYYVLNPGNITNTTGSFSGLASGSYTVCVSAVDAQQDSCSLACDSIFVGNTVGGCIATANYSVSISGLTATFTNSSTCTGCAAPMTYFWQFGDGATSTMANPTHTYMSPNSYVICLTVNGFDSLQSPCTDSLCDTYMVGASAVNDFSINTLNIYPNPTNGNFTIEVPEGEKAKGIIIEDITGRKIISHQYANSLDSKLFFDLKNNATGIYFIKLQTSRQLYTSTILNQE